MIRVKHKGDFNNIEKFMNRMLKRDYLNILGPYGEEGVRELSQATPTKTGKTADSWYYGIEDNGKGKITLYWSNDNENDGANIALLLIYGHGAMDGTYVKGINFVDPAMKPVFNRIAEEIWREVKR